MRRGNSCRKYTNDTIGLQKCSNKEQKKNLKHLIFLWWIWKKKYSVCQNKKRKKKGITTFEINKPGFRDNKAWVKPMTSVWTAHKMAG